MTDRSVRRPAAIDACDRFAPLRGELGALLAGLGAGDWERPTAAGQWSVKDVAAHLLGGDVGILSRRRDGVRGPGAPVRTHADLVRLVDRLNAEWVVAMRRASPRLLVELLAVTGPAVEAYFASLDPTAMGEPVSWAGPDPAPVWFDLAREFTERWHHQQQIRDATGRPPLYEPYYLSPVLDTFVRALPHGFRTVRAAEDTTVRFEISGKAGGVWFVVRGARVWELVLDAPREPVADVVVSEDVAWRMFTKGVDRQRARRAAAVRGAVEFADPIFATVAVIG
ncbi:MAG TPA: maleylpyruvate isomerase family mycothiol-dependent enzyme [Gemmatimonadales bacterium]|nr:maleylpyruvate isomerase family mycothiol-dependent enzyme [Gemmatimonadales bacterium]